MGAFEEVPIAPAYTVKLYTELLEISSDVHIVFQCLEKYCLQIEGYGSSFVWSFSEKNKCVCIEKPLCVYLVFKLMADTGWFWYKLRFSVVWKRDKMIFENSHGINLRDSGLMMCRVNFYSLAPVEARALINHRQSLQLTQAHFRFDFFFLLMIMQTVIFRGIDTNCLTLPFLSCVVLLDTSYPTSQKKQL